jgi:enoyl-CoA hydratase/carnithine racemase
VISERDHPRGVSVARCILVIEPVGRTGACGYGTEGSIAFPTLNRPQPRSGMNDGDVVELTAPQEQFDGDEAIVGFLKGAGPFFCSGAT